MFKQAEETNEIHGLIIGYHYPCIEFQGKIIHDTLILSYNRRINVNYKPTECMAEWTDEEKQTYKDFVKENDNSWFFISEYSEYSFIDCLDKFHVYGLLLFPNDFIKKYNNFLEANKRKIQELNHEFALNLLRQFGLFAYSLSNGNIHYFSWMIKETIGQTIMPYQFLHVMAWIEKYGNLQNKLAKKTVTSYHGYTEFCKLLEEIYKIRCDSQAKKAIEKFNTAQREVLKNNINQIDTTCLSAFYKLNDAKQLNFIKKVSTITDYETLISEIRRLCAVNWTWSKNSVVDYIDNNVNFKADIVINRDNILVVRVNDFEGMQRLGRTTSWCISKDKSDWRRFTNLNDQYMIFNFDLAEDDDFSIIGVTIDFNGRIEYSHNLRNTSLVNFISPKKLNTFLPINYWHISDILRKWNIDLLQFNEKEKFHYRFNKENVLKRVKRYCRNYTLIKNDDNRLVVKMTDLNAARYFLRGCIDDVVVGCKYLYLFFDFNISTDNNDCIRYAKIDDFTIYNGECVHEVYDSYGNLIETTFSQMLDEFSLPYDSISRPPSVVQQIEDGFRFIDFPLLRKVLSQNNVIEYLHNDKVALNEICYYIEHSVIHEHSYDFLNFLYEIGYTIKDFLTEVVFRDLLYHFIQSVMIASDCLFPTTQDFTDFDEGRIKDIHKLSFIGYIKAVRLICQHESQDVCRKCFADFKQNNDYGLIDKFEEYCFN